MRLLREAADAGCLMMLLTGGEPLLRPDFLDIYTAAKRLGMIVTVFTNASLVNGGGREIALKPAVDEAFAMGGCDAVKNVVVYKRTGSDIHLHAPRDVWWDDLVRDQADVCEPTWVNAEHPLFILYTSGSTGKPKGVQHASGGYILHAMLTMQWTFDYKPTDVFWCTADVGWVTGHTYITYGPLAVGATEIVFEGVPTYPDAGRFWKMIADHNVTVFYTAPTAIRSLIKAGADLPKKYDLSSLRLLGTVGEPINPEAWMWYYTTVGGEPLPDRGHLVADRNRRSHDHAAARGRRRSSPVPAPCRCRGSSRTWWTRPATPWTRARAASW